MHRWCTGSAAWTAQGCTVGACPALHSGSSSAAAGTSASAQVEQPLCMTQLELTVPSWCAVVPKDGSLTLSWPQGKTHGVCAAWHSVCIYIHADVVRTYLDGDNCHAGHVCCQNATKKTQWDRSISGVVSGAGVWRVPSNSCPPFPFQPIPPNQVPKVPPQDGGSFTIMCPDNEVKYYACPGA
jgi:hypothetical protein